MRSYGIVKRQGPSAHPTPKGVFSCQWSAVCGLRSAVCGLRSAVRRPLHASLFPFFQGKQLIP